MLIDRTSNIFTFILFHSGYDENDEAQNSLSFFKYFYLFSQAKIEIKLLLLSCHTHICLEIHMNM
jgi:hypothetical protein